MKSAILVLALVVVAMASQSEFDSFLTKHNRKYDALEYYRRFQIFEQNLKLAKLNQAADSGAVHGVTKFFDLTQEEFASKYLNTPVPTEVLVKNCLKNGVWLPNPTKRVDAVPAAFDWRTEKAGVVHKVYDQASCGSCWAFSTSQNIEGVWGVNVAEQPDLSPQWIVDCSKSCTTELYYGTNITVCNGGCSGGWPWSAFYDVYTQGGIPTWASYPYTGRNGNCVAAQAQVKIASDFACISGPEEADEDVMREVLMTRGPLSIALDANYFNSYKSGVMDVSSCSKQVLNHAVLLVGWGHDDALNKDYWIVKNSWGSSWGEDGYVRIVRGKGMCGINLGVSSACVKEDCSY